MSPTSNKNNYTVSELIQEPSFRRVVKGSASPDEIKQWNRWMEVSEENRAAAKEAATEIAGFGFVSPKLPDVEKEWSRLSKKTVGKQKRRPNKENANSNGNHFLIWIFRVAAVLILGIFVGLGSYIYSNSDQKGTQVKEITEERTIRTGSGERKTIRFSNGSKIMLNSNTVITYNIGWLHNKTIRVELEGEAYFEANGDGPREQPVFAVHTPGGIIRDIGTKFLVTVAKGQSNIVLQDGRVEVSTVGQHQEYARISAQQGEMLEFRKSALLSRKAVNPTLYTSWATGYMTFEETTIKEFAGFVERRFDVDVKIANAELSAVTLEGAVYFKTLSELVQAVSEVTNVAVYQSKDLRTIYIGHE